MRPQSSVGVGENIHKLKNSDKTMFYVFGEVKAMLAPTLLNGAYDFELEINCADDFQYTIRMFLSWGPS